MLIGTPMPLGGHAPKWPAWPEDLAQDENYVLDDATSWNENEPAKVLINHLFNTEAT
jgi:hypothetical protein